MPNSEEELLFHYTDARGFFEIIRNDSLKLWMNHASFLNDSNELQYAVKLFAEVAESKGFQEEELDAYLVSIDCDTEWPRGVLSFSKNGDLLSQWRAYADDGRGYALGFSKAEILTACSRLKSSLNGMLGVVTYDRNVQRKKVEEGLKEHPLQLQELASHFFSEGAPFWKSEAFQEEEEWRVVCDLNLTTAKWRNGRYGITPYHELEIDRTALRKIVLGPKNQMRDKHGVMGFFTNHHVELVNSEASYR